jgi:hypothetical protein
MDGMITISKVSASSGPCHAATQCVVHPADPYAAAELAKEQAINLVEEMNKSKSKSKKRRHPVESDQDDDDDGSVDRDSNDSDVDSDNDSSLYTSGSRSPEAYECLGLGEPSPVKPKAHKRKGW